LVTLPFNGLELLTSDRKDNDEFTPVPKVGVLALQGDFIEHIHLLDACGVEGVEVRHAYQLAEIDGLIIPGGESTTIGKLAVDFNLMDHLQDFGKLRPIWGTCAGAIFLSKDSRHEQPLLGLMDIQVARNAFGRQVDSFEIDLDIPALYQMEANDEIIKSNKPFKAIFIRAPSIEAVLGKTKILATLPDGEIVAAQEGHWLATSFHPELTNDDRFHRYFLSIIKDS
jgi:5'-phosphate synthase pdxT subunit